MGIQGVESVGRAALPPLHAASASAPHSGTAKAVPRRAFAERQASAPGEEQAPRPAPQLSHPRLRVDEESGQVVATIVGPDGSVIKQIPPEELLDLAARVRRLTGLMFDDKA